MRCLTPMGEAASSERRFRAVMQGASHPVSQHKAGTACFPDAVAEIVGLAARVGAEAYLVERRGAAAAQARCEDRGIAVADHSRKRETARPYIASALSREASGKLHAPLSGGRQRHALFEPGDERIRRLLERGRTISSRQLEVGMRSGCLPPLPALAHSSTDEPVMA